MGHSKDNKTPPPPLPGQPGARAGAERGLRAPAGPPSAAPKPTGRDRPVGAPAPATPASKEGPRGRIVHDERGNAVWDWLKETGRIAIESTSRLLRKLEIPEMKVEDKTDEELRLESDRDRGGGYDPYNQGTPARKGSGRK